jgi:flagellar hook-associated protein 2
MTFRSGGLMSGLDTNTLIAQLVSIERQPIVKLQTRQSDYNMQISRLGELSAKLADLKSAIAAIDSRDELLSLTASSTAEKKVRVTATGNAGPGSYDLTVSQLARAEKDRSVAFTSDQDVVRAGSLTVQVKGHDPVEIAIGEGASLRDVVAAINASDAEVSASIVNDGAHSYLFLTSLETGHAIGGDADDAIVITETYTGAHGTDLQLSQVQQARNARFTVDGLTVEKETNVVTDVVDGVRFELLGQTDAETPTVGVTVVPDTATVKDRFQAFVDAYNNVMKLIERESSLQAGTKRSDRLAGDPVLARIRAQLQGIVSSNVEGATGDYDSLASVGIKTKSGGTLSLNASKLSEALDGDFLGVANVLIRDTTGVAARLTEAIDVFTDPYDGAIKLRRDGIQRSIALVDGQIEAAGRRVDSYEQSLVRQFTALESMMSQFQTQGNYLASVLR